jgi:hypothetical protein
MKPIKDIMGVVNRYDYVEMQFASDDSMIMIRKSTLLSVIEKHSTRWIPVSERMPTEEDKFVLAWYATKYPFASRVDWYSFPLNNKDVTHWQRITPPEGKL